MNINDTPRLGRHPKVDPPADPWLSSGEAAALVGVDRRTLRSWEDQGLITAHQTPGGHRRYRKSEVEALLELVRRPK